jgi:uncharacterized protein (TIGR00369 family)
MTESFHLPYEGTIHEALDIHIVEASGDRVILEMDVTPRVHQPFGLLHGGASAVMAESAASIGAYLNVDPSTQMTVGTDLNISHLRGKQEGRVRATALPVRRGRTMQVWTIEIEDEVGKMIAVARCTLAVRDLPKPEG